MARGPSGGSGTLRPPKTYGGADTRQVASPIPSRLFTEGEGGYFLTRGGERRTLAIETEPIDGSQTMPLAVLIGPDTVSYAEVLAPSSKWERGRGGALCGAARTGGGNRSKEPSRRNENLSGTDRGLLGLGARKRKFLSFPSPETGATGPI